MPKIPTASQVRKYAKVIADFMFVKLWMSNLARIASKPLIIARKGFASWSSILNELWKLFTWLLIKAVINHTYEILR